MFLLATFLSGVCYWVNVDVAPASKNRMKMLFYEKATEDPASLFQAGRVLDRFPGYRIYTGERDGSVLKDLKIIELSGSKAGRTIRAKQATLNIEPGVLDFTLVLEDADIETTEIGDNNQIMGVKFLHFDQTALTFPLSKLKEKTERVNASMKSTSSLWSEISDGVDTHTQQTMDKKAMSNSKTELNKRFSFSLACLTFALIGVPLGVTAQRRETSVGFALSLITALVYMAFIIFGDIVADKPGSYPHLIMWVPNVLFLSIGDVLFYRLSQR